MAYYRLALSLFDKESSLVLLVVDGDEEAVVSDGEALSAGLSSVSIASVTVFWLGLPPCC